MLLKEKRYSMQDILETAAEAGSFRTFVAGVRAANLASILQYTRCLTLLAPTDDAFTSLPSGMIRQLLDRRHEELLCKLILGHILVDLLSISDLSNRTSIRTLGDSVLNIHGANGNVLLGGANVLRGDIIAANGIIHVIDKVLLPFSQEELKELQD